MTKQLCGTWCYHQRIPGAKVLAKKTVASFQVAGDYFLEGGGGMIELIIKKSGVERSRSPSALVPDGKTCGEGSTPWV